MTPFSICIHSLSDFIQSHGFKYIYMPTFPSQRYISNPTLSQNSRITNPNVSTWISIRCLTRNMFKTRPSSSLLCLHLLWLSSPCLLHSTHVSLLAVPQQARTTATSGPVFWLFSRPRHPLLRYLTIISTPGHSTHHPYCTQLLFPVAFTTFQHMT